MPLLLSVAILTKNEEKNLPRCLRSVAGLAAEIVVIDSGSTDGTERIARDAAAHFFHRDWSGYPAQRNAALEKCAQPWVLALDADEELSPALRDEIQGFFNRGDDSRFDGASFPRKVFFLGRWIRHGDWYPDRKLRLVRRDKAKSEGSAGHDHLVVPGPEMRLTADLHHYSFPDINAFLRKTISFGDEYLNRQLAAGKKWSLLHALFRPPWRFFRCYLLKLGFLDGFPGLWIAAGIAFQTFVRHTRLYEHEANAKSGAESSADRVPSQAE